MGIFMSRQINEYRPLADLMRDLKLAIENGTFTLKKLDIKDTQHTDALGKKAAGLKSEEIEQLAMHALEKNKMDFFDLIANNRFQEIAEKLQVAKLKKEIEAGKAPDLKQDFSCKVSESKIVERTGYMSSSQDQGDSYTRTEIVDRTFPLSDQTKVALVKHALQQNKPEVAKQLVVQLSTNDLTIFAQDAGLKETVKEETERRQKEAKKASFMKKLDLLYDAIKVSKSEYEKREKGIDWFRGDTAKNKKEECIAMLTEITRLKDLLGNNKNENVAWKLDEKKAVLADKKTLYGYAVNLNNLKDQVEKFVQPPESSAAAAAAAASLK